jgi:O-antigen ligase
MWALILLIMVQVGRIQEIVPGLSSVSLGKIALGLGVGCYLFVPRQHEFGAFSFPQIKYLTYLLVVGLCSAPFSYWPGGSFTFLLFGFATCLFMVVLLVKISCNYRDLRQILWATGASMIMLSVVALRSGSDRAFASSSYDPNDLALVLVTLIPLFYYMMTHEAGLSKLLLLGGNLIMLVALMATESRSGFVALCVVVVIILFRERVRPGRIVVSGLAVLLMMVLFTSGSFWDRMSIVGTDQDYNMDSGGGRIEIWKRGLTLVAKYPLLGVGPNQFTVAEGTTHVDEQTGNTGKWSTAHNSYLQVACEFGIPGFILYMMTLIAAIRSLIALRRDLPENSELLWLCNGLEISFYSFMVGGFFLSQAYASTLFLLIGLSAAVQVIDWNNRCATSAAISEWGAAP